jgi:predicted amidophosphoribosyltransferase
MALQQTYIPHNGAVYAHYYLCNYLPLSAGRDIFSHSLLKFKMGRQPDLSGWIDCSLDMLASGIPCAIPIPGDSLIPEGSTIVRALHHDEMVAAENPPTSLDLLGRALADRFQSHYRPSLISKTRPARKITRLTLEQREAELNDIYIMNAPVTPAPFVLIIDDILTTATTVRSILSALLNRRPDASIVVFTLAKADYDRNANNKSSALRGQNYQLERGMDWVVAEKEAIPHYSGRQLRSWIHADTF